MAKIKQNIRHNFGRFFSSSFFRGLDFKTSLIIGLGIAAYIIIVVDLTSELAAEKDEISFVIATLEKSNTPDFTSIQISLILPQTGDIAFLHDVPQIHNIYFTSLSDRAPPSPSGIMV